MAPLIASSIQARSLRDTRGRRKGLDWFPGGDVMRKTALVIALLAVVAGAQEIGEPAPAIECGAWANAASKAPPTLTSLKGKVVLLEFWFST